MKCERELHCRDSGPVWWHSLPDAGWLTFADSVVENLNKEAIFLGDKSVCSYLISIFITLCVCVLFATLKKIPLMTTVLQSHRADVDINCRLTVWRRPESIGRSVSSQCFFHVLSVTCSSHVSSAASIGERSRSSLQGRIFMERCLMLFTEIDNGAVQLMSMINTYRFLFCQVFPASDGSRLFCQVHVSVVPTVLIDSQRETRQTVGRF